jgi:hypothetical protein
LVPKEYAKKASRSLEKSIENLMNASLDRARRNEETICYRGRGFSPKILREA